MESLYSFIPEYLVNNIGWTLVHWFWQGLMVMFLLWLALTTTRKVSAGLRYGIALTAMAVMTAAPIVTYILIAEPAPIEARIEFETKPVAALPAMETIASSSRPAPQEVAVTEMVVNTEIEKLPLLDRVKAGIDSNLPLCVCGWIIGVCVIGTWNLGGAWQLRRLRRIGTSKVAVEIKQLGSGLAGKMKIKRHIEICESALVQVPTVIGWFKPLILLPGSAVTGLDPVQLQALLAHEMAHIKRYDFLINIYQTVIETLGFYHPGIWWISRQIRIERENCCDDIAIAVTQNRKEYATALFTMESIRHKQLELAIAANGGKLSSRIERLANKERKNSRSWLPTAVTAILLLVSSLTLTTYNKADAEDASIALEAKSTEQYILETIFLTIKESDLIKNNIVQNQKENEITIQTSNNELNSNNFKNPYYGTIDEQQKQTIIKIVKNNPRSIMWPHTSHYFESNLDTYHANTGFVITSKIPDINTPGYDVETEPLFGIELAIAATNEAPLISIISNLTFPITYETGNETKEKTTLNITLNTKARVKQSTILVFPSEYFCGSVPKHYTENDYYNGVSTEGFNGGSISYNKDVNEDNYLMCFLITPMKTTDLNELPKDYYDHQKGIQETTSEENKAKYSNDNEALAVDTNNNNSIEIEKDTISTNEGELFATGKMLANQEYDEIARDIFKQEYGLDGDETVRLIRQPFVDERFLYLRAEDYEQWDLLHEMPKSIALLWDKGEVVGHTYTYGKTEADLEPYEIMERHLGTGKDTIILDNEIGKEITNCDWSLKAFLPKRDYMAGFKKALAKDFHIDAVVKEIEIEDTAVTVSGKYLFTPYEKSIHPGKLYIFSDDPRKVDKTSTAKAKTLSELIASLQQITGVTFIDTAEMSETTINLDYAWNDTAEIYLDSSYQSRQKKLVMLLDNIKEQTGLDFKTEQKKTKKWLIYDKARYSSDSEAVAKIRNIPANNNTEHSFIPATSEIDEDGHIVDKIDYEFEDDQEVIGGWKSVDFVDEIGDFDPLTKNWKGNLFLNNLVFLENGQIKGEFLAWTKGLVINKKDKTAGRYIIKTINGSRYLFMEWKSGDYTVRHQKPAYYVLKEALAESLANETMAGENAIIPPTSKIDENGHIVDKTDYDFVSDPQVMGKWQAIDYVKEIDSFDVNKKSWTWGELFLKTMHFNPNGTTSIVNGQSDRPYYDKWTKGLVLSRNKASKYIIKKIDGIEYMFYEWKSGDYTIRHRKPDYYVLKKCKMTIEVHSKLLTFKNNDLFDLVLEYEKESGFTTDPNCFNTLTEREAYITLVNEEMVSKILELCKDDSVNRILGAPVVNVFNSEKGEISFSSEIVFVHKDEDGNIITDSTASEKLERVETGLHIEVTPEIVSGSEELIKTQFHLEYTYLTSDSETDTCVNQISSMFIVDNNKYKYVLYISPLFENGKKEGTMCVLVNMSRLENEN